MRSVTLACSDSLPTSRGVYCGIKCRISVVLQPIPHVNVAGAKKPIPLRIPPQLRNLGVGAGGDIQCEFLRHRHESRYQNVPLRR